MYRLVLLRHGQSEWNAQNKFCGWFDADLTARGKQEAQTAGNSLKEKSFTFDIAYTSVLQRAQKTLAIVLEVLECKDLPVVENWRLNERHYGALQGLNKKETAKEVGEEQVHIWRRSYDIRPPALDESDVRHPKNDSKYANLLPEDIPSAECLKDTVERFLPFWESNISKDILAGKKVLICAHGNSLRALVKHLDAISDEDISSLNIPTGVPLVYELDENLKPLNKYYLADPETLKKLEEEVANQGKA